MIFLSFHILKKEYRKHIYLWYLIGLPSSSIISQHTKCKLFSKKVEFLGHTVSAAGVGVV